MKILFDGDSITDCYRTHNILPNDLYANEGELGVGYPMLVSSLLKLNREENYLVNNVGVAGDRICDLLDRIDKVVEFKPDYYVLMIGINDLWRMFETKKMVLNEDFENNYRKVLSTVKNCNNNVKFIIQTITYTQCENSEPIFVKEVEEKNVIIKKLANEFNAELIDTNKIILENIKKTKLTDWLFEDGVHYTAHTNMIVANKVIELIK